MAPGSGNNRGRAGPSPGSGSGTGQRCGPAPSLDGAIGCCGAPAPAPALPSIALAPSLLPCPSCGFYPALPSHPVPASPSSILCSPTGPDPYTAPAAPVEAAGEVSGARRAAGPPLAVRPRAAVRSGPCSPRPQDAAVGEGCGAVSPGLHGKHRRGSNLPSL